MDLLSDCRRSIKDGKEASMALTSGNSMLMLRWLVTRYIIKGKTGKVLAALLFLWGGKKLHSYVSDYFYARKMERVRQDFRDECKRRFRKLEDKIKKANVSDCILMADSVIIII